MKKQSDLPYSHTRRQKSLLHAYLLCVFLGFIGAHHFYLRRPWYGIAYLLTFGLFGCGYVVDLVRMPLLVRHVNMAILFPELRGRKNLFDAYVLWFPCGLLGFHLFYLRKPWQGLLYMFSLAAMGEGFIIDIFRIPKLVEEANKRPPGFHDRKSLCKAYFWGISPFGILGAHHYYLDRPEWGLMYTLTFGLGGFGWLYDWFRMSKLVDRANSRGLDDPEVKYLDDMYCLWFPLGIFGFHQFYLHRIKWGILYFLTFGLCGFGWVADFFKLSILVQDYNDSEQCTQGEVCEDSKHSSDIESHFKRISPTTYILQPQTSTSQTSYGSQAITQDKDNVYWTLDHTKSSGSKN